jgi:putative SOS response-associated peptidase YedK
MEIGNSTDGRSFVAPFSRASGVSLLRDPYPADEMRADPVSTHVNNVRNQGEACIAPAVEQQMF